jgi:hypothetical protein
MHEEVHPHAEQERQPKKPIAAEDVDTVLVSQQETTDDQRYNQINAGA